MDPNGFILEFEKPLLEVEQKIAEFKQLSASQNLDLSEEIARLEQKHIELTRKVFQSLTPWQRVQIARHPSRPQTQDYVRSIMENFCELSGDRLFGDDRSIITGFATFAGRKIMVVGHNKGKNVKERHESNSGSSHPEGYRKALAKMQSAAKFGLPIVTLIDTPGAYPGIGAEERGQARAIAHNLQQISLLRTPIVCIVIGEGCSGGAIAIGVGDKLCILEHAYFSVISPEGCSAILWKDKAKASDAAEALKLTSSQLLELGLVDEIIPEPAGGAHRSPEEMYENMKASLAKNLDEACSIPIDELLEKRYLKFRRIGVFTEGN